MNRLLLKGLSLIFLVLLFSGCLAGRPGQEISFVTPDGVTLSGRLAGIGETGVILSHMKGGSQVDWWPFARVLEDQGYTSLVFDFRGYGKSGGEIDLNKLHIDLQSALKYLQDKGISEIFLVGASMGGTASIKVASEYNTTGIVTISAPVVISDGLDVTTDINKIEEAKLFIAAEDDKFHARTLDLLLQNSTNYSKAYRLSGANHGTDIFDGENGDRARGLILDFMRRNQ